jgi:hypothetical protein
MEIRMPNNELYEGNQSGAKEQPQAKSAGAVDPGRKCGLKATGH